MHNIYEIAGVKIKVNYKHPYIGAAYSEYEIGGDGYDFEVSATDEEIEAEKAFISDLSEPQYENLAIFRKIADAMLESYNALVFHSSAISYNGKGILVAAKSGTGKSTLNRRISVSAPAATEYINDDKPIIRLIDGVWYVFGTPWMGKHRLGKNTKVPLKAIILLTRGENKAKKISGLDALKELFTQTVRAKTASVADTEIKLFESLIKNVSFIRYSCLNEDSAATYIIETVLEKL